jgi:uncharacterized RDD family membrane protein YckC
MDEAVDPIAGDHPSGRGDRLAAYASPLRRFVAYLLDECLAVASIMVLTTLAFRALMASGIWGAHLRSEGEVGYDVVSIWNSMGLAPKLAVSVAFFVSFGPLYFLLMESSPWQATLGKRLLGVYVTGDGQRRIRPGSAAVRWIVKALFSGILVLPQLIVMTVSRRRKAIHDFAARTVVLPGRTKGKLESWRLPVAFGASALWILATFVVLLSNWR